MEWWVEWSESRYETESFLEKCWRSMKYYITKLLVMISSDYIHRAVTFWGVLVLLKFYWAPDIVKFVLGRFSHFNIAIAYSNSTFCGTRTPSFCEFTQIFSKTSTPLGTPSESTVYFSCAENHIKIYVCQGCARFTEILLSARYCEVCAR